MTLPAAQASSQPVIWPVPRSCYLCASMRLSLRFRARGVPGPDEAQAYNCTSFGHRNHPPIWVCDDCGMMFQWPMKSQRDLVHAYEGVEDPLYVQEKQNRYLTFRRLLKILGPGQGRSLLDVGAYCGYFLDVAREGGFEAEGLELSRWAGAQARSLGFTIHGESLEQRPGNARYDVITLWDVIEHFADPREELKAVFRLVKPGGRAYLSTIDVGSLFARVMGAQWPWLMDMHLFYFDRSTLAVLAQEVGFKVQAIHDYTHTVSSDYLLRKAAASFTPLAPIFSLARRVLPKSIPVPVNLGDNMLMVLERP